MSVQAYLRKEWGPFRGLYKDVIGSVVPSPYAITATDCLLDNDVLEVMTGDAIYNTGITSASSASHTYLINFTKEDNSSATADHIYYCNGTIWRDVTASTSNAIGHTVGTATITNGSTTVSGFSTTWNTGTEVQAGDYIKRKVDADSAYQIISSVNSDTSITLTANWSGTTLTNGAYIIRKQFTGSDTAVATAITFKGGIVITNGTEPMQYFSPDDINQGSMNIITSAPLAKCLEIHKSRCFAANTTSLPHDLFWSPSNAPSSAWNASATGSIYPQDGGGEIVAVKSYNSRLFVFKRYGGYIYEIRGDFPTTIGAYDSIVPINTKHIGILLGKTVVEFQGLLWFVTSQGLYYFDGSEIKLANRGLENFIASNGSLFTTKANSHRVFSTVFKNRMIINLVTSFAVVDKYFNITLQTHPDSSNPYMGSFAISKVGDGVTPLLYVPQGTNLVNFNGAYLRTNNDDTTPNVNNTFVYETGEDYLDSPEYNKDFYKFYVVAEETSGTQTILFAYDIDKTGTYVSNTLTLTGTASKIQVFEVPVRPVGNITTNSRGRCIRWRIKGNNTTLNFRVIKVILRYGLTSLR